MGRRAATASIATAPEAASRRPPSTPRTTGSTSCSSRVELRAASAARAQNGGVAANLSGFVVAIPDVSKDPHQMAVKLRLTRVGKTKQPQYRIVAADSRSPRDGRFIEIVGHYNPRTDPSSLNVDEEKAAKWLRQGAQPTDRVRKLLEIAGVGKDGSVRTAAAATSATTSK